MLIKFLQKYRNIFNIKGIEREVGMKDTLQKAVNGTQGLPGKWEKPLRDYLVKVLKELLKTK